MDEDYKIAEIYKQMELHLISSMRKNLGRHLKEEAAEGFNWKMWQAEKLKELKRYQKQNKDIINSYTKGLPDDISKILKDEFKQGAKSELNRYNKLFDKNVADSFFKLNDRKANALIKVVNKDLNKGNRACLRMINDQYRKTIYKAATFANTGVMTTKQAVDMATKDFLNAGFNVIEYKNGRRVNISSYSQMAVRTASQRAMLMGEGEFRKEMGESLVIISKHGTSCKICQQFEGKVFVDDVYSNGKPDKKYKKLLSNAMDQGLFHPNCRHGVNTYYDLDGIDEAAPIDKVPVDNDNPEVSRIDVDMRKQERLIVGSQDKTNRDKARAKLKALEIEKDGYSWVSPLNEEEQKAAEWYTSGEGQFINQYLRGNLDIKLYDNEKTLLADLKKATNKVITENKVLYRSVDATAIFGDITQLDYENLLDYVVYDVKTPVAVKLVGNTEEKELIEKGFMSTTKDYEIASNWGGFTGSEMPVVLELEVPEGAKGIDLTRAFTDEYAKEMAQEQAEVLLHNDTKYKIKEITKKDGNILIKAKILKR